MKKVLVADDCKEHTRLLQFFFKHQKFKTLFAMDGQEALDLIKKENFDLIVVDLNMPKISGCELLTLVKDDSPKTPVFVASGHAKDEIDKRLETVNCKYYFDEYFQKPFDSHDLINHINKYLKI